MSINSNHPLRVCQVLPRGMAYSKERATSIDLFVCEIVAHSRYWATIVAEFARPHLPAKEIIELPRFAFANSLQRAYFLRQQTARIRSDLVIVQQHLPSAYAIAQRVAVPTILQKHNFVKPPRSGPFGVISKALHLRQFRSLAGITLVSETVKKHFETHWPEVDIPRCVVHNGVDSKLWIPQIEREKTILLVGRATPEKGFLESARALSALLPKFPLWRARFILSEIDKFPDYYASLQSTLAPLQEQAEILVSKPFQFVKEQNQKVAIALIPSKWEEPFGRTCLEAHAGGAAVISSGSGGLREISGDTGVYLDAVNESAIYSALEVLVNDDEKQQYLAKAGRQRVVRLFDLKVVTGILDDFCADLVDASRSNHIVSNL